MRNSSRHIIHFIIIPLLLCAPSRGAQLGGGVLTNSEIRKENLAGGAVKQTISTIYDNILVRDRTYNVAIIKIGNSAGESPQMDNYISGLVRKEFEERRATGDQRAYLFDDTLLIDNMKAHQLKSNEADIKQNYAKWNTIGVDLILIGYWRSIPADSIRIDLEMYDIAQSGSRVFSGSQTVLKDFVIKKILNEKIPAMLMIKSRDHGTTAYIDSYQMGKITKKGIKKDVGGGEHTVRVEHKDYGTFSGVFYVPENEIKTVTVKCTAPYSATAKAFLWSAFLPGSAGFKYDHKISRNKGWAYVNMMSAGLLYATAIVYIFDSDESRGWFTKERTDRFDRLKDIELGAGGGLYLLNLISGYILGYEYMRENRQIVEVAAINAANRISFGIQPTGRDNVRFSVNYGF